MARNLDEPGANFNQLLELSIKLQNARTFAGSVALADESYNWEQGDWTDPDDESVGNTKILEDFVITDEMRRKPNAAGGRIYGKYAQQLASGGRVGLSNGGDLMSKGVSWLLSPQNLERLKNNKDLVRKLTKNKMLPSSVRLYLRNLAGVTDKITEDFFSKSELAEIKKRVTEAEVYGSMGYASSSGVTNKTFSSQKKDDGVIGYSWGAEPMSIKAAFTSPESNIDMTLGQATFSKDEKGNFIVKDVHDFHGVEGSGYAKPKGAYLDYKGEYRPLRFPKRQEGESDKQLLKRAKKALEAGNIGSAKYARIIAGLKQPEGIPVELNIGKITQEDKYKAERDFAKYIATDTIGDPELKHPLGKRYEDVGIPSEIRKQAQEYLNAGGRVGYGEGDIVLKAKPYNAETFKEKSDLYLQAILGTSDKDFYRSKLQNEYKKAMKEGALSAKEAMEWVQKRAKLYSTLIDESKRQKRSLDQELRGVGGFSLPTSYGVEPDINKYFKDKKAMGGRVGLKYGTFNPDPMKELEEKMRVDYNLEVIEVLKRGEKPTPFIDWVSDNIGRYKSD